MQNLIKRFFIASLATVSIFSSALIDSRAIAQTKLRTQEQIAAETLEHRKDVKQFETACNDATVLETLRLFRNFQTRVDTGVNYNSFLDHLADLKIALNDAKALKNLSSNCDSLRFNLDYALTYYESFAAFWQLNIAILNHL